jgi:hypothetical protein
MGASRNQRWQLILLTSFHLHHLLYGLNLFRTSLRINGAYWREFRTYQVRGSGTLVVVGETGHVRVFGEGRRWSTAGEGMRKDEYPSPPSPRAHHTFPLPSESSSSPLPSRLTPTPHPSSQRSQMSHPLLVSFVSCQRPVGNAHFNVR